MIFEVRSIATRRSLRTPQEGQKQPQDDPWTPRGGSKMAPRWHQDAPRRLQDGYKTAPRRPKTAPRRPRTPQGRPKTPQDHPKDAPRPLQDAPRPLQDAQRPLEDHPMIRFKTLQDLPQGTAKATPPQDHSKTVSHSHLGLDLVLNIKPVTKSGTNRKQDMATDLLFNPC